MRYGSVCSGIEAATIAWHPLGWEPQWFSEIESFPCKVLKYHYPHVPNIGDMTKLIDQNETFEQSTIDLLVGGTPCQSFSIAGLRGGLDDERGNLALEFCRILVSKQPRWFVWENVPGVFSSNSGRDFATILQAFRECGYSCSYRILDSQNFGVPQRRRRIFVVGYLGNDWRPSAAVLFERESLRRDLAPGGKKRQKPAGTIEKSTGRSGGAGINPSLIIPFDTTQITSPLNGNNPKDGDPCHTLSKGGDAPCITLQSSSLDCRNMAENKEISGTLQSKKSGGLSLNYCNPVAYSLTKVPYADNQSRESNLIISFQQNGDGDVRANDTTIGTLNKNSNPSGRNTPMIAGTWLDGGQTAQTLDKVLSKGQSMPEKNRFPAVLQEIDSSQVKGVTIHGTDGTDGTINVASFDETAQCLRKRPPGNIENSSNTVVYSIMPMNSGKDYKGRAVELPQPLMGGGNQGGDIIVQSPTEKWPKEIASTLNASMGSKLGLEDQHVNSGHPLFTSFHTIVRRLTPIECERLQGFPDNYTLIPGGSNSARYSALGNSMTTNVMAWIGGRIDKVDKIIINGK